MNCAVCGKARAVRVDGRGAKTLALCAACLQIGLELLLVRMTGYEFARFCEGLRKEQRCG